MAVLPPAAQLLLIASVVGVMLRNDLCLVFVFRLCSVFSSVGFMQPDLIRAVFGAPAQRPLALDPMGCYSLRLFDRVTRTWQYVVVDDFVPVDKDSEPYYGRPRPRPGSPGPVSIWYCLLEKALAKLVGGYSKYDDVYTFSAGVVSACTPCGGGCESVDVVLI